MQHEPDPVPEKQPSPVEIDLKDQQDRSILDIARGGGVVFIGTVGTRALSYIYSLALIWGLGAGSFGQFTLALAVVMFIGLVSTFGMPQGILRFGAIQALEEGKAGVHRVTISALRLTVPISLALTAAVILLAGELSTLIFHKPELADIIRLLALAIPFMSLQSTLLAGTRALKIMKYSAIVWVAQPLTALLLAILFILGGGGAESAALAYGISYLFGAGLALFYYLRLFPPEERRGGYFSLRKMLKFSIPLSLTEWMHFTNERIEIFFLGMLPGTVDISIYKIAWSLAGLETMLRLSLEQILAPFSSDLTHRREIAQLEGLYKATAKWGFLGALMIFLVYALFSREILQFFDPALAVGSSILIALAFAQLFNEFTGPCNTILIMSGRSGLTLFNTIFIFIYNVAAGWLLIPRYGLTGAAIVGASAVILINIMRVVEVWLTLKIHPWKLSFLKPIAAGLAAAGIILLARQLGWLQTLLADLIAILVFCAAFLALVFLLKLDAEDQVVVEAMKRKLLALRSRKSGRLAPVEADAVPIHTPQDIP